jgi:anaerobic magnesium-protoporphyrin IX monomethyl ester cyclase
MMNILMVNPPYMSRFSRTSRSPGVPVGGTLYYPCWLAYATGVLEENGFTVSLIDAPAEGYSITDVIERAKQSPPALIVVDTSTPSIYNDVKVAEGLKDTFPGAFIVLVGTHPSALPEETLGLSDKIDAVAKGEYDFTIRDLAFCLQDAGDLRNVDGLIFREGVNILHNGPRSLIENLDELPFVTKVYKKHLNIKNYFFSSSDYPMVQIYTSRGCPYRCFFCVYPQTFYSRKFRPRSPANVVDEFEYVIENLPEVRDIEIEDDTFTIDKKRVSEICQLILARNIKIRWSCSVRVNMDLETMLLMKEAGCKRIGAGFESGDQNSLNLMNKGITVEQIREFANNARKAGLVVHGCFIFGNPGETRDTMEKTLKLSKELNTDTMQFYALQVYPGTEAYEWAKSNNYLINTDYSKWLTDDGLYNCLLNLPELNAEEINAFCKRAYREYYLRPRYILTKAKRLLLEPSEIRRTFMSAKTFFKYILPKV